MSTGTVVVGIVIAVGIGLAIATLPSDRSVDDQDRISFEGREKYHFESAEELASTAEAVVIGTVKTITPGRVVGDPGGEMAFVNATIEISQLLAGSLKEGDEVIIEFSTVAGNPRFAAFDTTMPWWQPGASSVLFLRQTGNGAYHFIGSEAIYFLPDGGDGPMKATFLADPVTDKVAGALDGQSVANLVSGVLTAVGYSK